jgi:predicted house-cleaning noncanonical NTP pyrophosphatase (MazG superfamily)
VLCYGHQLGINKKLNNFIYDYELVYDNIIDGKNYEVSTPYHGGQCAGDLYSTVFGIQITDDDNNPNYVSEVRSAKESDYKESYDKFLSEYINEIYTFINDDEFSDEKETLLELVDFLNTSEPCIYSVELSS